MVMNVYQTVRKTVAWYLDNDWWWGPIRRGRYAGRRLGI